jgi:tRNA dimethylallyltransferase
MDIGTATPSPEELARVRHYFINERDPDEGFSAGEFGMAARKIIEQKLSGGESVIVCGGSGLYIQAIKGMISDELSSDQKIRASIHDRAKAKGWSAMYEELKHVDPEFAAQIDEHNPKRISRALEIWEMTGKKPSLLYTAQPAVFPGPLVTIGLAPERSFLYGRIDRRVLSMIKEGLVDEVSSLLKMGYSENLNALNTVGYKEIIAYLKGKTDLETAVSDIQKHTRHFAKRQMTWFRKYAPDRWIEFKQEPDPDEIVEKAKKIIVEELKVES